MPASIPDLAWAEFPPLLVSSWLTRRPGDRDRDPRDPAKPPRSRCSSTCSIYRGYRDYHGVEEPVEYKASRPLGSDARGGTDVLTLRTASRKVCQDPDVILVGEIRAGSVRDSPDMPAPRWNGHLVFTSLHTRDAKGAISRYADLFPRMQKDIRAVTGTELAGRLQPASAAGLAGRDQTGCPPDFFGQILYPIAKLAIRK